ncbi:zf-PARP-domain-containing protein [Wallemia mellicola]|uniref:Zf-PARP-domain-containing protein n=1 Tax=Wallemia mellicola TaxID=1708541 RepID=A0A4T0QU86_9BASI|nr:zf-PARP-domain-containing protein [Wallemia mellicola]TIB99100.1 zf-PARP-domain-containing protein [Wallemia mellicola]TIC28636.1 zf-PARP-domain-containing protein [Wallemia mellicola]
MNNILNVYSGPEEIPGFKELCDEHKKAVLDTFENFEVPSYKIPADPKAKRKRNNKDRDVANHEGFELESDYTDEEPIGIDSKPVSSKKEMDKPRGRKGSRKTKGEGRSRKIDGNSEEHEESDLTDLENSDQQPKNEPDVTDENTHDTQYQQSEEDKPADASVKHQTRSATRQQKRK